VTDAAARTPGHIAYLAPLRSNEPMIKRGDTLAALRTWKNAYR
jgi:hypothetical protein